VSKKRPSSPVELLKNTASYWKRRVFQNSYTRRARRFTVDKWSVKIQYEGQRRTFSLKAINKGAAAEEARQLYLTLLKDGWEGLDNGQSLSEQSGEPAVPEQRGQNKLTLRYWKQALVVRPGTAPSPEESPWSAWLDHEGAGYYFPLSSKSPAWAAAEALRIYEKVRALGWAAVFKVHPREVTVALHWKDNPLAWTYTTFSTLLQREKGREKITPVWRVQLIEADKGLRLAMEHYVNEHPGFICEATHETVKEARRWAYANCPDLVLVNESIADGEGAEVLAQLTKADSESTLGILFSVYADSAQLFKCSPGGALGYLFKRTPPERMLEPLLNASPVRPLPALFLSTLVAEYFQEVLNRVALKASSGKLASLTPRESQILEYLSKGFPDKEIAGAMGISAWTVHGHLKSIFEKLQVHNRLEAVLKYLNK
jgi:DNA-binding NarL/FixJ family response regulator